MGYARHIGRVGALAVTLGVGAAIANSPGIAYADSTGATTNDNQQNTTTSSTDPDTTTGQPAPSGGTASQGTDDTGSTTSDRKLQRRPVLRAVIGAIRDIADGSFDGAGNAAGATSRLERRGTTGGDSAALRTSTESTTTTTRIRARVDDLADASDDLKSAATSFTQRVEQAVQKYTAPTQVNEVKTTNGAITTAPQTLTTAATPLLQPTTQPRTSVVPFITNPLGAFVKPLLYPGPVPPFQLPTLMAVLVAVRDEIERLLVPRSTQVAYPPRTDQPVDPALPDPTKQHVLVIAVDGTNLSEVIQEDDTPNTNFEELMSVSTVSAPSIVGHTSISNPSWTAVLTGAWVERTGVDQHNTFTPWTYDRFPTVFTQLENYNPAIRTKQIGDWDVIGAISASGEGADEVVYIAQQPDDVEFIAADAAVTQATVDTLDPTIPESEVPNFMVTYLAQVDEAGHIYGGDSPEYDAALLRTDQNLGAILDAVAAREAATGEDWTVIVVTDHGHQPQPGFGHGLQSPRETETFVIVNGPQFDTPGCGTTCARFNPDYEIVDVTPTVLSLFGAQQPPVTDGVPLQSLNGSSSALLTQGELEDILEAQMAANDFPNIFVNVALAVRSLFGVFPYLVHGSGLPSPLLEIAWIATNVPDQIVAFATGVYGARLFPILPPPPAITFIPDQATSIETAFRTDCGGTVLDAERCIAV